MENDNELNKQRTKTREKEEKGKKRDTRFETKRWMKINVGK